MPAQPYLRVSALIQPTLSGKRRDVFPLIMASRVVSRNVNYTMIVICGFFFFVEAGPRYVRNVANAATAAVAEERKLR